MLRSGGPGGYSRDELLTFLRWAGRGALIGAAIGFPVGQFAFAYPNHHPIEAAAILAVLGACARCRSRLQSAPWSPGRSPTGWWLLRLVARRVARDVLWCATG